MIHEAKTPEAYLDVLDDDWRKERVMALRAYFLSLDGVSEGMQYKMLAYKRGDDPVAIMNAQKGYVSVYMDDLSILDPDGSLLAGYNCGKSCIRLRKTDGIDVVKTLVGRRLGS
ncbi:MAG: DUF1801 domain-containing protein [Pseudomonadota bacterium]